MRMMRSQHLPLNPVACANRNGGSSPGHSHTASSSPRSPTNFNSGVLSTYVFSHARDREMPPADWRYDMHWNAAGSLQARMNRSCCRVASILQAGIGLAISAFGQSLVEPERIPHVRQLFATAASAPQLRCEISPVLPALTFGFRFQAGYKLDISLDQFRGSAHALSVHTRVTPQGRAPVYLTKTEMLPDFPEAKVGAVTGGTFVVGDGAYGVELLVEDDLHRSCRGSWQIQARRTGSERQLKPATPQIGRASCRERV